VAVNRVLTQAEVLGITGDEPPLTDADIHTAVTYALSGWRGEWLLDGGDRAHYVRTQEGGCAGWPTDHCSISVGRGRRGLLVCIREHPEGRDNPIRPRPAPATVRTGHIPWRTAEVILRQLREPAADALFDLEGANA
jgi:hypothetical protein